MSSSNGSHSNNGNIRVHIPPGTDFNNATPVKNSKSGNIIEREEALRKILLSEQAKLIENAGKDIVFSPPIITLSQDVPVFRRRTINVIQGKFGTHKSRFAELFCSLLLQSPDCSTDFAGFSKNNLEQFSVCYIDTEHNTTEEFPAAIQTIRQRAGFDGKQNLESFHFYSIKKIERSNRLQAVKFAIEEVRKKAQVPLFVVLDVVTDCVASFNQDGESMALFDYLGNLCDDYQVTFLLLIHENPGTEKARGHTGSEAANKASTVFQIAFEKDNNGEETILIKLKFIKLRTAQKPPPLYLQYNPDSKGLVSADPSIISQILSERQQKAEIALMIKKLEELLHVPMEQKQLVPELKSFFNCSPNTIKERLNTIAEENHIILNAKDEDCHLKIQYQKGKSTMYSLVPVSKQAEIPFEKSLP